MPVLRKAERVTIHRNDPEAVAWLESQPPTYGVAVLREMFEIVDEIYGGDATARITTSYPWTDEDEKRWLKG